MTNRREFLLGAGAVAAGTGVLSAQAAELDPKVREAGKLIVKPTGMPITGTFLDEISDDIPHQNWGAKEWDADFRHMKAIGIDTVIMIRCGIRNFITYPSKHLMAQGCYQPSVDLLELFLSLSDKYSMKFFFGLFNPLKGFDDYVEENKYVIEEVSKGYMHHASFAGWYISSEIGRKVPGCIEGINRMGRDCKAASGGKPTFISPWIDGRKAVAASSQKLYKEKGVTLTDHEREWAEILDGIHESVDYCAFQDGHLDYNQLDEFFAANKRLCDKVGMRCWMNAESFDRDMPIKFLPTKFDKLRLKLEAAARCGLDKAITFEFSHFMSPQSVYSAAGNLYNRYREYFGI